jgi:hypothetical protein
MRDGLLSGYAAVVATLALGWNIYRDVTDRGKLTVKCWIAKIIVPGGTPDPTDYLSWTVTNVGRQPAVVVHIGGGRRGGGFLVTPRSLPKALQPGEYLIEYTHEIAEVLAKDARFLAAYDSRGGVHKARAGSA